MAWQRNTAWTPLDGGDLSHLRPDLSSEDTSYLGPSESGELQRNQDLEIYEMRDVNV